MRRSERASDPWSGHWAFPGGRRDAADCDLLDTALRELHEECGIQLMRNDLETELPRRFARQWAGAPVPVTPFIFRVERELAVRTGQTRSGRNVLGSAEPSPRPVQSPLAARPRPPAGGAAARRASAGRASLGLHLQPDLRLAGPKPASTARGGLTA